MEYAIIGIIVFLFILAVFDLSVGVSNDAVNFLNSAVGARAARFRTVVAVAAVGVFIGAALSDGMMDIARHGIFRPEHFSLMDLLCIFTAVMVTDIILLDVFNTLGLPTSTTVSMVFELLGASTAVALLKLHATDSALTLGDMLNTEKALSVIIGIFLSVAIAFVFGTVVMRLARLWFRFDYRRGLRWKIGLFGGASITLIVYFLLIKGARNLTFMTPELKGWVASNTWLLLGGCLVGFTLLCQLLHALKVNVLRVVVLTGTFALAMAFAGNDLVNFIGVPLSGLASYQDYAATVGADPHTHLMGALNAPASTPWPLLAAAGAIMVVALATSKKARKVVNTSVNLSSQVAGADEMFGSSRPARRLVRYATTVGTYVESHTPERARRWMERRLDPKDAVIEQGAAFDLVRGSINLVLAAALIALGTSLKLPLSTTYVTFMVAMGTSLADRAWGRESAVFRITGVISVIGGWFLTAVVAFIGAALIVSIMHIGGAAAIVITALIALVVLVWRAIRHREQTPETSDLFRTIIKCTDPREAWTLLRKYIVGAHRDFLEYAAEMQQAVTQGFLTDSHKMLSTAVASLSRQKQRLKNHRRRATLCLRSIPTDTAVEKSAWFYLGANSAMAMLYNLRRIAEVCHEHVDNNFRPLPACLIDRATPLCDDVQATLREAVGVITGDDETAICDLRSRCNLLKNRLSAECRKVYADMRTLSEADISVLYVYLNLLQEQQELISALRKLLRADHHLDRGAGN